MVWNQPGEMAGDQGAAHIPASLPLRRELLRRPCFPPHKALRVPRLPHCASMKDRDRVVEIREVSAVNKERENLSENRPQMESVVPHRW